MYSPRTWRDCCSGASYWQHRFPGIYAKPIIDLLVEVEDITSVDEQNAEKSAPKVARIY